MYITKAKPFVISNRGSFLQCAARGYQKSLTVDKIDSKIINAQYAVRGAVPLRGEAIKQELLAGKKFPFNRVTPCNIGNPQAVGQGHVTFNREVISAMMHPGLLKTDVLSKDAQDRANFLLSSMSSPMGAYTSNSKGHKTVRKAVGKFIEERDGVQTDVENIYLTNGASEAVRIAFKMINKDYRQGILIPIPQYPLYSAQITLDGGTMVSYYLDEEKNWGVNADDIMQRIKNAKDIGIQMRGIVVINPGNPTGNVLQRQDIEDIIKIAYEESLVVMADEVYQNNIYYPDQAPFVSFRKVLHEMGEPWSNNVELISMHSTSKGLLGECGLRGGYMEAVNINADVSEQFYKLKSVELCSNTVGQLACELMVNPPKAGRESSECVELYNKENGDIFGGMKTRAKMLSDTFNSMDNTNCQIIQGSMYGFPQIMMSDKAVKAAKDKGQAADFMYCMEMVEATGIMTVPGSGFGQKDGTWHYRITNLVTPTEEMAATLELLEDFNTKFHNRYD